ncbi:MAG: LapA family protein [Burkholderiales bacterium]
MRALAWVLRIVLFLALFLLALKNTDSVSLHLYFDQVWRAPLILVLLVFFVAGAAIGVIATLTTVFRQRRENARLRRELSRRAPAEDGSIGAPPQL